MTQYAVLLVNLGTPDHYDISSVRRYLKEFLMDGRVIDIPFIFRYLLVNGIIIPKRVHEVSEMYKKLWLNEGSPLKVNLETTKNLLQEEFKEQIHIEIAMRYQNPSLKNSLDHLKKIGLKKLLILPLFPQYASATTGSIFEKIAHEIAQWETIPEIEWISHFFNHPEYIEACCAQVSQELLTSYDHVVFSFHGLPQRHVKKGDVHNKCLSHNCCQLPSQLNCCYKAQCHKTADLIAQYLKLQPSQYDVCFQSRLGKEPWIQPYAEDTFKTLAKTKKKVLVFAPSFVSDCLETTIEIQETYAELFVKEGGESLTLVESLNTHPLWIKALKSIISESFGK